MAAKKKGAKNNSAKKEKRSAKAPKKAARASAPKTPKKRTRSAQPTSGQSGPPLELTKDKLNDKEEKVVSVLQADANPMPINALATNCFSNQSAKTANSWVRNSLRRLVRGKWVEKIGKGTYRLTDSGRKGLEGSAPAPKAETPAEQPQPSA
jgi:hypothetical protein